jgi:hypothetical protein
VIRQYPEATGFQIVRRLFRRSPKGVSFAGNWGFGS